MRAIGAQKLCDVADIGSDYDVIGIDEGQFFPDVRFKLPCWWIFAYLCILLGYWVCWEILKRWQGGYNICPWWHLPEDRVWEYHKLDT